MVKSGPAVSLGKRKQCLVWYRVQTGIRTWRRCRQSPSFKSTLLPYIYPLFKCIGLDWTLKRKKEMSTGIEEHSSEGENETEEIDVQAQISELTQTGASNDRSCLNEKYTN